MGNALGREGPYRGQVTFKGDGSAQCSSLFLNDPAGLIAVGEFWRGQHDGPVARRLEAHPGSLIPKYL